MLTLPRLLGDLWATIRRDGDVVSRVAAPFVFLPALAVQLLADPPPALPVERDQATVSRWVDAIGIWGQGNALWYLAADALAVFGLAATAILLLAPERPTVGEALRLALSRYWRFLGATLLIGIPVGLGLWLFILPGLFVQARFVLALPLLAARPAAGVSDALRRSIRATRGRVQFAMFSTVVTLFIAQILVATPFQAADAMMRAPGRLNPFVLALADAGMAAAEAGYRLAVLLLGVAIYRRFANRGT